MLIKVFRYAVPAQYVVLDEHTQAQLRAVHDLRNHLVELELSYEQDKKDIWSSYPQVAAAEDRLSRAEALELELVAQARQEHSQDRAVATRTQTAAALRAVRRELKQYRVERRAAITEVREDAKPRLTEAFAHHKAQVKDTYRQHVQEGGLYWASYNATLDDHRTRVKLLTRKRTQGEPAQLRFHRWTGESTLSVQVKSEAGKPVRSPALLESGGGPWRNVLRIDPWELPERLREREWPAGAPRTDGMRAVRFATGGGHAITLPVKYHRPLPADADITNAQFTVRRRGASHIMSLTITVRLPDPKPPVDARAVALHLGWRTLGDGAIRVATWASDTPITAVPDTLADTVAVHDGGRRGEVVLRPAPTGQSRWLGATAKAAELRSGRDLDLAAIQDEVAAWLDQHPQPDPSKNDPDRMLTGARVRAWKSPSRLAALVLRWRDDPPPQIPDGLIATVEAWRVHDRHLWQWQTHGSAQAIDGRDYLYRCVAAWLAGQTSTLIVDDSNLAELRRHGDAADDDPVLPGVAAAAARSRAHTVAPGRLRALAVTAAESRGVTVQVVPAAGLTRTHAGCGHTAGPDPRYAASATVECPGCGTKYDQDRNAVALMLRQVGTPGTA